MRQAGDRMIALLLLLFTLPLMAIVALAIKLESSGPVLSCDDTGKAGRHRGGRLRFRTTVDHEYREAKLTRVGWFLHYTRIEDLPQLVNVLRGELSLIGLFRNRVDYI